MKAGKLALLAAILLFGLSIDAAHRARDELSIGPTGCRVLSGRFYGPSFEFDSETRRSVGPTPALLVENLFGAVVVEAGEPGEVEARLRTRVYLADRAQARAFSEGVELVVEGSDEALRVGTNRVAAARDRRELGFETDLELRVPAGTRVEVRNRNGRVDVSGVASIVARTSYEPLAVRGIDGPVELTNRHGAVRVGQVSGDVRVDAQYGEVTLEEVAGAARVELLHGDLSVRGVAELQLDHRYGDLDAEDVAGTLAQRGAHASVTARQVAGGLSVETSYGDVLLSGVAGAVRVNASHGRLRAEAAGDRLDAELRDADVHVDGVAGPLHLKVVRGEVDARGLRGGARIESDGRDVQLWEFEGPIDVSLRRGDLRLRPVEPLLAELKAVAAGGGSIVLEVPAGSRFALVAASSRGAVGVELDGFAAEEQSVRRVVGRLGDGGPDVSLRAERGDVSVSSTD